MLYIAFFALGAFLGFQRPSIERFFQKRRGDYSVFRVHFNDDAPLHPSERPDRSADFHGYGKLRRDDLYMNLLAHKKSGLLWSMGGSIKRFEVIEGADDYARLGMEDQLA